MGLAMLYALTLSALTLLPVVPAPGEIICLGVNCVDHAKEGGSTVADYPALFLRCNSSLLAHGAPLQVPRTSSQLDFEAELALVMGTPAGVGYARTPPVWMKAGDTIEVEIESIGVLSNPVV